LMNMSAAMGKPNERQYYLTQLNKIQDNKLLKNATAVQIKLFQVYYYHSLIQYNQGDFEAGVQCVQAMEKGLQQYRHQMDTMGIVMLCFYAFHVCFGAGQHAYAQQWLQQILIHDANEIRQDIYHFSKILLLINAFHLHYKNDSGNEKAIINNELRIVIRRTYRFLLRPPLPFQLNGLISQLLKKINSLDTFEAFQSLLPPLKNDLETLKNDPFDRRVFAYFDFLAWVQSQINGQSFGEFIKQQ